jgi:hypothetical protein
MQGSLGNRQPVAEAVHVVPLLSLIYFEWAGIQMSLPIRVLMWFLALFFSVPMLAYLEAIKIGMKAYTPGLASVLTQSKAEWLTPGKSLKALFALLPYGPLMAVLSTGHGVLYVLVVWQAYAAGLWPVLGVQVVYLSYLAWTFVFVRANIKKTGLPPSSPPESPPQSGGKS